jgi:ubiquinone/menaquinone biosynthesis C-methylase UbiE
MGKNIINYDKKAVEEYHKRWKKYISYGLDPYKNAEFIVSHAEPLDGSILEVGTGRGGVTACLARKTAITTVDIDQEIQSFAEELAKSEGVDNNIRFLLRNIIEEPFPEKSFEIVISANAVHHFVEAEKMIAAMCKIAVRKVVIADFNAEGFRILDKIHEDESETHSQGHFPIDKIGEVMKAAGLRISRHTFGFLVLAPTKFH